MALASQPLSVVRVALLICDVRMKIETFEEWLAEALKPSGSSVKLEMTGYNVYQEEFPSNADIRANKFDALMITGARRCLHN